MTHYVYTWYTPDGTPFYVGAGKSPVRWKPSMTGYRRNSECKKVLAHFGVHNILYSVAGVPSQSSAYRYERALVVRIGRIDLGTGTLTNLTDGGAGSNGLAASVREKLRGTWALNTERKAALSTMGSSEENRERAIRRAADPNDKFSKNGSAQCARINADPELTAKRIAALKNASAKISAGVIASAEARSITIASPEVKAKMKLPKTAEHNRKNSEAKKLWWAKKKASILPQ